MNMGLQTGWAGTVYFNSADGSSDYAPELVVDYVDNPNNASSPAQVSLLSPEQLEVVYEVGQHTLGIESRPVLTWDSLGDAVFFASGWLSMMIAYGAPVPVWRETRPTGLFIHTPLHLLALYAPPDAVDVAQLLIAAGNDIDAQMSPYQDMLGPTPLCWCLTSQEESEGPTDSHFELARFLIEQGCDVLLAHRGYMRAIGYYPWMAEENLPQTLLGLLAEYPQRPESVSFAAYFREKLEALGVNLDADSDSGDDSSSSVDSYWGRNAHPQMY